MGYHPSTKTPNRASSLHEMCWSIIHPAKLTLYLLDVDWNGGCLTRQNQTFRYVIKSGFIPRNVLVVWFLDICLELKDMHLLVPVVSLSLIGFLGWWWFWNLRRMKMMGAHFYSTIKWITLWLSIKALSCVSKDESRLCSGWVHIPNLNLNCLKVIALVPVLGFKLKTRTWTQTQVKVQLLIY